jgi:poly(A) polymerase
MTFGLPLSAVNMPFHHPTAAFRSSECPLPSVSDLRNRFPEAVRVVQGLRDAGFSALFAGGCVRDLLLGRVAKDIDIASSAAPEQVEALFPRTHAIGKVFGVIQVLENNLTFEVATFRRDIGSADGRRPERIESSTPEEDALRRDFTINGLFLDPLSGDLHDFVGGRKDLALRRVRAIGNPTERFQEDHLRLLRALRFSAVLGFELETETRAAIEHCAHLLPRVSVERIRQEFVRILCEAPRPGDAIEQLDACGLLCHILPEFLDLRGCEQPPEWHPEGDVWTHTLMMLNLLDHPSPALALAVLLHDIGKPATRTVDDDGRIRFTGHAQVGAAMAERWMTRMKFSNAMIRDVTGMVDRHMNYISVTEMRRATLRKVVAMPTFVDEAELHRLDCLCSNGITASHQRLMEARREWETESALPVPWIGGRDLLDLGLPPGPELGHWKTRAYEEQLEGHHANKAALLAWLREQQMLTAPTVRGIPARGATPGISAIKHGAG